MDIVHVDPGAGKCRVLISDGQAVLVISVKYPGAVIALDLCSGEILRGHNGSLGHVSVRRRQKGQDISVRRLSVGGHEGIIDRMDLRDIGPVSRDDDVFAAYGH